MALRPGIEWGSDMGSLISQDQLDTVVAHVEDAVAKGATVLAGGKARPDLGPYFYEPTILEGVTPEMTCFGNETFGPVISLYRFHDEADAVSRANDGEYGLNASIYSRDTKRARIIARQVKCGTVNINEAFGATFASIDSPMGGMRESGHGPPPGQRGHPALHRVPVGRRAEADPVRADVRDEGRDLREGDDRQPPPDEEAGARLMAAELRLRRPGRRLGVRWLGHARCG